MQRRLTKKLSDVIRHDHDEEESDERPTTARRQSPRPVAQPPVLLQQQPQRQYSQQRPGPTPVSYSEQAAQERGRTRSRNAAFLPSEQDLGLPRGGSQPVTIRSDSPRQPRPGSEPPPPWRNDYVESNDVLQITSEDLVEDNDEEDEEFVQDPNSSELLVEEEEPYEVNPVQRSSSSRSPQPLDRQGKKPKKPYKNQNPSLSRKQSKSKTISFQREKGKRDSSRSSASRSRNADEEDNGFGSRRGSDYFGRAPSSTQVSPRASMSREIAALPIEIPESVTDADAFRRYLSRSESSMDSTGLGLRTGRTATNLNAYPAPQGMLVHRRTIALSHAIMTLALLSASSSQLRFVVAYAHALSYPGLNYFLVCSCIIIEIIVGIGYVVLSRLDFSDITLEKIHTYLIFGLFFVAVANVIIASFALDDHVCEMLAKKTEAYDSLEPLPPPPPMQVQPQIAPVPVAK